MSKWKAWLLKNENSLQIPTNEVYLIVNDIDGHSVAVKAGKVFPITYAMMATVN